MELPEVGARNSQPTSSFAFTYTAKKPTPRVRLRIDTSRAVASSVMYGGVPMTLAIEDKLPARVEHHFEIHNPPIGSHMISGTFSEDVFYLARVFDDAWVDLT